MLFILLQNSTLVDEKTVFNRLLYLFVWNRSNAIIRSTFFNKDRSGKGDGGNGMLMMIKVHVCWKLEKRRTMGVYCGLLMFAFKKQNHQ